MRSCRGGTRSTRWTRRKKKKKLHRSNTRPFHTCVIQEYQIYTMCWSLYYESLFIPWVQVNTMSLSLYHESFAISDIQFNTMSPSLHQDFKFIPWVLYTKSLSLYHESKSIPWTKVYTTLLGLGRNQISHKNKYNLKSKQIQFHIWRNPISQCTMLN